MVSEERIKSRSVYSREFLILRANSTVNNECLLWKIRSTAHGVASLRLWPLEPFFILFLFSQNNTVSKVCSGRGLGWEALGVWQESGHANKLGHLTWVAG